MRQMVKLTLRLMAYFVVFVLLAQLFTGASGTVGALALLALILTVTNSSIRPVLTLLSLPLNLVTFGIASVFVNMLTLLIADAIVAGAFVHGFWLMALASAMIMGADAMVRWVRFGALKKSA